MRLFALVIFVYLGCVCPCYSENILDLVDEDKSIECWLDLNAESCVFIAEIIERDSFNGGNGKLFEAILYEKSAQISGKIDKQYKRLLLKETDKDFQRPQAIKLLSAFEGCIDADTSSCLEVAHGFLHFDSLKPRSNPMNRQVGVYEPNSDKAKSSFEKNRKKCLEPKPFSTERCDDYAMMLFLGYGTEQNMQLAVDTLTEHCRQGSIQNCAKKLTVDKYLEQKGINAQVAVLFIEKATALAPENALFSRNLETFQDAPSIEASERMKV